MVIERLVWLRTDGVNTKGAAAKAMNFDRLGKKVRPGTFGKDFCTPIPPIKTFPIKSP